MCASRVLNVERLHLVISICAHFCTHYDSRQLSDLTTSHVQSIKVRETNESKMKNNHHNMVANDEIIITMDNIHLKCYRN